MIGRHRDGGFAVWDQTVAVPLDRYAASDWPKANADLDRAEADAGPSVPPWWRRWLARILGAALLMFVIVVYLYVHTSAYDGCLNPPGLFSWPSALDALCIGGG